MIKFYIYVLIGIGWLCPGFAQASGSVFEDSQSFTIARATKLSVDGQNNTLYDPKMGIKSPDKSGRFECLRNSDCPTGGLCADKKCVTCIYGACISYTPPPNSCGSTSTSVMAVKSHPSCPDKPQTCSRPNLACTDGKVCSSGSCVCSGSTPYWNGTKCVGCLSNGNCRTGDICSNGSCTACSYGACINYVRPQDSCGSTTITMDAPKSNDACPSKALTCYRPGLACSSVQKCSNGACVSKCDGVSCSGLGSCNPTSGICECVAKQCCISGMYFSNGSCSCVPLTRPPCGGTLTLVPAPLPSIIPITGEKLQFTPDSGVLLKSFEWGFNLKSQSDSVASIFARLFGVSQANAAMNYMDSIRNDEFDGGGGGGGGGGGYNTEIVRCMSHQTLSGGRCIDNTPIVPLCLPPTNGYCLGTTKYCNSGYTMSSGSCVANCTTPANGYCDGPTKKCNSGYILTSSGRCVAQARDDAGCLLYKYSCECTAPTNGSCSSGTPVCNSGYKMVGNKCLAECNNNAGYCGSGLVCNRSFGGCCATTTTPSNQCDLDSPDIGASCGDIRCAAGLTCYKVNGCGQCCPAGVTPSTSGGFRCLMSATCDRIDTNSCSGGRSCSCAGGDAAGLGAFHGAHVCFGIR